MTCPLVIDELMHMRMSDIAHLTAPQLQDFVQQTDEILRKASLLRKWLEAARMFHDLTNPQSLDDLFE
jgi:hypothetical protein